MKNKVSDNEWLFRICIALAVGMLLGGSLINFWIAEDCRDTGKTKFAGGLNCGSRYGDSLR